MKISTLFKAMLVAALFAAAFVGQAFAQGYPNRPVRLLVPFPPGGGTDILARIVAPKMSESMGQQVLVDNRPGGNTLIATENVIRASGATLD